VPYRAGVDSRLPGCESLGATRTDLTSPWVGLQKESRDSFSPRGAGNAKATHPPERKENVKKIKQKVVEPIDDADPKVLVTSQFVEAGWPREDAGWLAELCADVLRSPSAKASGSDHAGELNTALVARAWTDSGALGNRNLALLRVYARMIGCGGKGAGFATPITTSASGTPPALSAEGRRKVAATLRSHGADFESALVSGGWPGDYSDEFDLAGCRSESMHGVVPAVDEVPTFHRLMRSLVVDAQLELSKVLDEGALVGVGVRRTGPDPQRPWRVPPATKDRTVLDPPSPRLLTTWLIALGPVVLGPLVRNFDAAPNDPWRAALAFGIQDAIERWLCFVSGHWTYFEHVGTPLAEAVQPICAHLDRACAGASAPQGRLREAWLWFGRCAVLADAAVLDDAHHERLMRAANEELARLRPLFARAAPKQAYAYAAGQGHGLLAEGESRAPWEEFEWERELFETCVVLLYHLGGVWAGMKPLLLAMRSLACPSVASDLRYWSELPNPAHTGARGNREQPPETWSIVPTVMINLFHACVGEEQAEDADLVDLRGQLAAFSLRGLADRWTAKEREAAEQNGRQRTNDDMLERSPDWRYCLVRAAMALHVNPEGKAHRLLHAASRLDPDPDVRGVAHEAYEKLRRSKGLPEDVSPRRCVMTALWWVRQAHLLALGVEIDADGAQRTRVKELTRTKDQERAEQQRINPDDN